MPHVAYAMPACASPYFLGTVRVFLCNSIVNLMDRPSNFRLASDGFSRPSMEFNWPFWTCTYSFAQFSLLIIGGADNGCTPFLLCSHVTGVWQCWRGRTLVIVNLMVLGVNELKNSLGGRMTSEAMIFFSFWRAFNNAELDSILVIYNLQLTATILFILYFASEYIWHVICNIYLFYSTICK